MRDLSASVSVRAPARFTVGFLSDYVCQTCDTEGSGTFTVRFTIRQVAGLTLERDVTVHLAYHLWHDGRPAELDVRWDPDASFYPQFSGMVHCEPTGEKTCTMTLAGGYETPGGLVGQLFDSIIGVRIAHGTLQKVLEQFRLAAEDDYMTRTAYD